MRRESSTAPSILTWLQSGIETPEILWCASQRRQHLLPTGTIRVCDLVVSPTRPTSVRDLGVYIDADLSMRTHVATTVGACFAALREIRSVRRSLSRHALLSLVRALVVSKVDYCNSVLAGISRNLIRRLQSVMNAAARLVFSAKRSDRITPLLHELHWLKVPERIQFRLGVLVYRCLHNTAPVYLAESLQLARDVHARRHLRSAESMKLILPETRCSTCSTLGDRAFPVSAARTWNVLPSSVRAAPSLATFRQQLKQTLFLQSFPDQ